MQTTVGVLGIVAGLMSIWTYGERYRADGAGWWRLALAHAVTAGLVFLTLMASCRR
jgi:hypothetical protein